ncbi:unnamed protein product [Prorocentrum cordatum]|uniref:Uncharacterized protein n=1 Tax=Prorocentrum cordatum TaxID=2364126 RepID=A0ABN9VUE9_9DINO|nr:unnamed protein product [Polarella glacialis]
MTTGPLRAGAVDSGSTAGSADLLAALEALADCAGRLATEPLKGTIGNAAAVLVAQVEASCRDSVKFLLAGLCVPGEGADAQNDRVWVLHQMCRHSESAKRWFNELGGSAALGTVLGAHGDSYELVQTGVWLAHEIHGPAGIIGLFGHDSTAVRAAALWALHALLGRQKGLSEELSDSGLVACVLEALRAAQRVPPEQHTCELQLACCSVLQYLLEERPIRSSVFLAHGGGEALTTALRAAFALGEDWASLVSASAKLATAVAAGSEQSVQQLRRDGLLEALVNNGSGGALPERCAGDVLWALGQIGGVAVVLEAMVRLPGPGSLRGGMVALAERSRGTPPRRTSACIRRWRPRCWTSRGRAGCPRPSTSRSR